jgi:hypothetical protein
MKLTKDESRILSAALQFAKFEFNHLPIGGFDKLTELENRLEEFGKDQRRKGRKSQDDWSDLLKRYSNTN